MIQVNRLRGRIAECGLTQKEVAEFLDVGQDTFGKWLREKKIRSDYMEKLAQLLEVESYDFFFKDKFESH